MSYNPKRIKNNKSKFAAKQRAQTGGRTHGAVLRSQGIGHAVPAGAERVKTANGVRATVFSGKDFSSYYECIFAGNNLGFGVHRTGDKSVRVLKGTLFLITAPAVAVDGALEIDNTAKQVSKIVEGSYVNLPAMTAYSLSTSGSIDVELLVTESAGYADGWVEVEGGVATASDVPFHAPAGVVDGSARRVNSAHERTVAETQAMGRRQRKQQALQARQSPTAPINSNSASVIGVNPMPRVFGPDE